MLAWDKLAGRQPWDSFADVEFAWHSRPGKATVISHLWKGIVQSKVGGETPHCRREHPTMKPIRVMQWCIGECRLAPGATILDPYMGSGTTGIAAFFADLKFVGVEIERRWFDAAVEAHHRAVRRGVVPRRWREIRLMAVPSLLPPARRLPSEWAESELRVPDGPRAGQRLRLFPFQREILDSLAADDLTDLDVMGSSQWGKSIILMINLGWVIVVDPSWVLYVMPNDQGAFGARKFSSERVTPFFAQTPSIARLVHGRRAAGGSNTVSSKTFPGGMVAFVGAESSAGLAGRPIRRVFLDEVDRFPARIGARTDRSAGGISVGEGNPREIARKRTETFGRRRMVAQVSTPVNAGGPIHTGYLAGDQRRLWVACPACHERGILGWLAVDFDLRAVDPVTREPIGPEPPPVVAAVEWSADDGSDAAFVCRRCAHRWSDGDRLRAVEGGEWIPERPEVTGRRSFHIWAGYSPLSRLPDLAAEWIAAQAAERAGDIGPSTTFRQTGLGLPVGEDQIVTGDLEDIRQTVTSRIGRGPAAPDLGARLVSVDVHGSRLDVLVTRWLLHDNRWRCWVEGYEQLHGESTAEPGLWEALTALVDREQPVLTAVDSGFRADPVYAWVGQDRAHRMAVKGYAGERPLLATPQRPTAARMGVKTHPVPVWIVGTDAGKSRVYDLLQTDRLHIPREPWADREFVLQLTSEHEVHAMERGHWVRRWEQVRRANHVLDTAVYALAAAGLVREACRG